jgi:prevent-host-death family protein
VSLPARSISIYALKAHLSQVVSEVEQTGTGVLVTRHGRPVAQVLPAPAPNEPRRAGLWRGKMSVPDGWDEFTDQDAAEWYGA